MRGTRSKASAAGTDRIWQKSWLCSVENTWNPSQWLRQNINFKLLVFNPANQKLIEILDGLQKVAKDAFGVAYQAIIEQFIYVEMHPHLKKSINQAHLQNGTYEQILTHLERELELNSLESPDENQMNTVTQKQQIEGNKDNAGKIHSQKQL